VRRFIAPFDRSRIKLEGVAIDRKSQRSIAALQGRGGGRPESLRMPLIPARFERTGSSKVIGCLVYLVVAPFVTLFLALFLAIPMMYALEAAGMPRERASTPFIVLLPLVGIGVAMWGYRDYRRRAALEVTVDHDRITIRVDSRLNVVRFDDVASIRLAPAKTGYACVLATHAGQIVRLPPEIASFAHVEQALELTLIRQLVARLNERIAAGEAEVYRIPTRRLALLMARGLGSLVLGVCFLAGLKPGLATLMINCGVLVLRQSWAGRRGGLILDRVGVRGLGATDSAHTPWASLDQVENDAVGLLLRSKDGKVLHLSWLTDDFWPASRWIASRVQR
jgi:hypothetical protein